MRAQENEADSCSDTPSILRSPKVNCCFHKSPPLLPVWNHMTPVHTLNPSIYSQVFQVFVSFRFSYQNFVCPSLLFHAFSMLYPSHTPALPVPNELSNTP
jgi:hypothetical protein